jgi:hypothetical protein
MVISFSSFSSSYILKHSLQYTRLSSYLYYVKQLNNSISGTCGGFLMLCKRMVLCNHLAYLINYHYMLELILQI